MWACFYIVIIIKKENFVLRKALKNGSEDTTLTTEKEYSMNCLSNRKKII